MNITTEHEALDAFDYFLDEVAPEVNLLGINYSPARVLRLVDPIHYRTAFNDWCDAEGIDTDEFDKPEAMLHRCGAPDDCPLPGWECDLLND